MYHETNFLCQVSNIARTLTYNVNLYLIVHHFFLSLTSKFAAKQIRVQMLQITLNVGLQIYRRQSLSAVCEQKVPMYSTVTL